MVPADLRFTREMWRDLLNQIVLWLPKVATAVALCLLFWLAGAIAYRIIVRIGAARGLDPPLAQFLGRGAKITLLVFGLVTALGTVGIDIAALVAGLGLTGFALGFALKDIVSNIVAGVLIMVYRPFEVDDQISVSGFQGKVAKIDLRYTVLDTHDRQFFVPNQMLFTNAITVEKPTASAADPNPGYSAKF